jgi:hypothetical protein
MNNQNIEFDKKLLARCGLYCAECSFKTAYDEKDEKHLDSIPYPLNRKNIEEYDCNGCKSDKCICGICNIKPCAIEKNIESCAECGSFPCDKISQFGNDGIPQHKDAFENPENIKKLGYEKWFETMKEKLFCKNCGERQSWYYKCEKHY